ncbi:MAG: hypothetical protein WC796_03870 [Candidatus Pacearchaeota archaeon]|jgi:hypothetical protein
MPVCDCARGCPKRADLTQRVIEGGLDSEYLQVVTEYDCIEGGRSCQERYSQLARMEAPK